MPFYHKHRVIVIFPASPECSQSILHQSSLSPCPLTRLGMIPHILLPGTQTSRDRLMPWTSTTRTTTLSMATTRWRMSRVLRLRTTTLSMATTRWRMSRVLSLIIIVSVGKTSKTRTGSTIQRAHHGEKDATKINISITSTSKKAKVKLTCGEKPQAPLALTSSVYFLFASDATRTS